VKQFLGSILFLLIRVYGDLILRGRKPASAHPRILLVRSGHLGDLVLMTPVLQMLRSAAPDASITLLVASGFQDVVARHPAIDHVLMCPLPSRRNRSPVSLASWYVLWQTARRLRAHRYDLAINLRPRFWWGAVLLCLAGIPLRIGYATARSTCLLTHTLPRRQEHVTAAQLRLVSAGLGALGYRPLEEPYTPERYPLYVRPTPREQRWLAERLHRLGIGSATPLVVIHPGSGARVKQWRSLGWARCISELASSWSGPVPPRFLLTGGPSERPLLEAVALGTCVPTLFVTDATLGQLAALLQRAQLVLGVDSGPLHLAVAQGTPTLQVFGPTDPGRFGPWGPANLHKVVASRQRCPSCPAIPCGTLYVPRQQLAAHPCVRLVSEQQVLDAVAALLPPGQRKA
jgi:ADP-heptose:LPS heptosyltransferase